MVSNERVQTADTPQTGLAAELRATYEAQRRQLRQMLDAPGAAGVALARRHADVADRMLRGHLERVRGKARRPALLIGAVGGYGRQLLGLRSDLDVCFLTTDELEEVSPVVEAILYPLWDAGIDVGHQVVRVADAVTEARDDLLMATELLDFRPLRGTSSLMRAVQEALGEQLFSEQSIAAFIQRLEEHAALRHQRFGDSVYLLEPDVKNGTGGLRDLDFALWAARARFGTRDLRRLEGMGVLGEGRLEKTERAVNFLWTVRNHLHHTADRKLDRLTFAAQESVAAALGYGHDLSPQAPELERIGVMVERFMSDYYRHARVVAQARDRILGYAKRRGSGSRAAPRSAGKGLIACAGRLGLKDPEHLCREPIWALRIYEVALARDMSLLSRTRDAITAAAADPKFCDRLREHPAAGPLFVKLVCACRPSVFPSGSTLGELHDVGLLLAMIPEFAPVVGRVHHDLYHVYTVDVHSVAAVDRLGALTRGECADEHPLACRLAAEAARPRVLFLATLLHDIGKVIGGHEHAARGAAMAPAILRRLGLPEEDIEDVCHLVLHHLTMYRTAVRRDLSDPAAIREFVRDVRGLEGLRDLYLLTVADLSTTSAAAMTEWKASMLAGLYRAAEALLAAPANTEQARIGRVRSRVRELWGARPGPGALEQFLGSMPERYILTNEPRDIALHAQLAIAPAPRVGLSLTRHGQQGFVGVSVVARERDGAGVCVVAGDRPGLLASVSAAIHASRLSIQSAQIHSRSTASGKSQAVDLFWVNTDSDDAEIEDKLVKLRSNLAGVLDGQLSPETLVRRLQQSSPSAKPFPKVPTEVVFDHHGSERHTIIEVLTEDRPALLFMLTAALHSLGVSISVAKICTEGRRAIDVFYASEHSGSKIDAGPRSAEIRAGLMQALSG